jgi:lyso-ornithine lipid O-acyltransferase
MDLAQRILRLGLRSLWFVGVLLLSAGDFVVRTLRHRGALPLQERTRWLQRASRRALRVFRVEIEAHGPVPTTGLLVSNHLSYLDILVLATLVPAVFVSKSELKNWPVFGWFGRLAGTLFVERSRRSDVGRMSAEIRAVLAGGHVVVLFPEGTSWNGRELLPFKSSLLEPIVGSPHPLSIAGIGYTLTDGSVENDVCYWGDMTFFPHLVRLMARRQVRAQVRFAVIGERSADRKELARQLHAAVLQLLGGCGTMLPPA